MTRFNILSIIAGMLYEKIGYIFHTKKAQILPEFYKKYRLIRQISEPGIQETLVGLYENNQGQLIVIKSWEGQYQNFAYLSLINEIAAYKTIDKVLKRMNKTAVASSSAVTMPNYVYSRVHKNRVILAIEYVEGNQLESSSDERIIKAYRKCVAFLRQLSDEMTDKEKKNLSVRTKRHYTITFLLSWVVACVKNIDSIKDLIVAARFYIRNVTQLSESRELSIVHRDLSFKNILLHKNKIYIIDLQMMLMTYPIVEYVNTLQYCFDIGRLKNEMIREISKHSTNKIMVKVLILQYAVQCLTNTSFSPQVVKSFKKYLQYGVSL